MSIFFNKRILKELQVKYVKNTKVHLLNVKCVYLSGPIAESWHVSSSVCTQKNVFNAGVGTTTSFMHDAYMNINA